MLRQVLNQNKDATKMVMKAEEGIVVNSKKKIGYKGYKNPVWSTLPFGKIYSAIVYIDTDHDFSILDKIEYFKSKIPIRRRSAQFDQV